MTQDVESLSAPVHPSPPGARPGDRELDVWAARLGLSAATLATVRRVRDSDPLRRGSSSRGNLSGRFPSQKMGFTLGLSAKNTEGLGLLSYELDPAVIAFWEEPPVELKFSYQDRLGRDRGARFHPDALVLAESGAFLDEWKTEEQLIADQATMPGRYVRDVSGWRCPSAEESARRLGLTFRLRTPATISSEVVHNGSFLSGYLDHAIRIDPVAQRAVEEAVLGNPGITLDRILATTSGLGADDLYLLIARGVVYVDLARHRLADTFYTPVFSSRAVCEALTTASERAAEWPPTPGSVAFAPGSSVQVSGADWTVVANTERQIVLRAADGALLPLPVDEAERLAARGILRAGGTPAWQDEVARRLRSASPSALAEAERRYEVLARHWRDQPVNVPARTVRDWQRAYRRAEQQTGVGFIGLIGAPVGRPKGRALDVAIDDILEHEIATFYETADAPTKTLLYGRVREACTAAGLEPPSYQTIINRLRDRKAHESERLRRGTKAAYPTKDYVWYLASDTPIHGERPWEVAHIDHTELDVVLVDSENGEPLGRPWLTLMIDAYSRRILAVYLTFDEPSYRSLMMVVRRCVERWNRLPERFVVDGGVEFGSIYFEQLLSMYHVELTVRPGEPRFGAVIERFFGALNTRLVHSLAGNTKPTKDVRSMSRNMNPEHRAVWTLARLAEMIEDFCFTTYDQLPHPALGTSPRTFYETRLAQTGLRSMRLIANDEAFFLATLPTTRMGTAKVDLAKGIKVNGLHYRAPQLRRPGVPGSRVPVRYDPMDVRHAYAFVAGEWVECWCFSLRRFPPTTERLVAAAISAEQQYRIRRHGQGRPDTASTMAEFLDGPKASEKVLRQQRYDAEARSALGLPPTPPPPIEDQVDDPTEPDAGRTELEVFDSYA